MFGFGITVVVAAAAYGVAQGHSELLYGLPAALALLCSYALQVFGDVAAMGAARRAIEDATNRRLKAPVLIYDTVVAPERAWGGHKSWRVIVGAYAVILVAAGVSCFLFTPAPEPHGLELKILAGVVGAVAYLNAIVALGSYRSVSSRVNDNFERLATNCQQSDGAG
jgi:hypothetical protein